MSVPVCPFKIKNTAFSQPVELFVFQCLKKTDKKIKEHTSEHEHIT